MNSHCNGHCIGFVQLQPPHYKGSDGNAYAHCREEEVEQHLGDDGHHDRPGIRGNLR